MANSSLSMAASPQRSPRPPALPAARFGGWGAGALGLPGVTGHRAPLSAAPTTRAWGLSLTHPRWLSAPPPAVQHLPPAGGPPPAAPAGPEEGRRGEGHPEGPPPGAAARGRPRAQLRGRPEAARPGVGQPLRPPKAWAPGPTWSCPDPPRPPPPGGSLSLSPPVRGASASGQLGGWVSPACAALPAKSGFCPFSGAELGGRGGAASIKPCPPARRGQTPMACSRRRTW